MPGTEGSGEVGGERSLVPVPIDIDRPRWDQSQFTGRLQYFARITNPLLIFRRSSEFEAAASLVGRARQGYVPHGTTVEQLHAAKVLYDSAYHPDTGERMNRMGCVYAMVPASMALTGILCSFYRTFYEVVVSQWINQSYMALVNFTNRNAKSSVTNKQILAAYLSATTCAVTAAVGFNALVKRAPPVVARWVPFAAISVANCINVPLMRQQELIEGVTVYDAEGNPLGTSRVAPRKGIFLCVVSRLFIAAPGMVLIPSLMHRLERIPFFNRGRVFSALFQAIASGSLFTLSVPAGMALFPQQCTIKTSWLERSTQDAIAASGSVLPTRVYFNKGL